MIARRVDEALVQRRWLDPDGVREGPRATAQRGDAGCDRGDTIALLRARVRDPGELRRRLRLRRNDRERRKGVRAVRHVRDDALQLPRAADGDAAAAMTDGAAHLLDQLEE